VKFYARIESQTPLGSSSTKNERAALDWNEPAEAWAGGVFPSLESETPPRARLEPARRKNFDL